MNFTLEVILILLSVIPLYSGSYLLFQQYRKFPDIVIGILSLAWCSYASLLTLTAFSLIILSEKLFLISGLFLPLFFVLVEIAVSYVNYNKINTIRMTLITIASASIAFTTSFNNSANSTTFPNGDKTIIAGGIFRIAVTLGGIYILIIYVLFASKIYYYATGELKFWARLNLLGTLILSLGSYVTFIFTINQIIPGMSGLIFSFGTTISIYTFLKRPQLLYILPFKATKLLVIKEGAGLPIYSYQWEIEKSQIQDMLFSAAIDSINSFTKIAIQKGNITQIKLENSVLILHIPNDQDLYYVLLTATPSHTLRMGLEKFSTMFYLVFHSVVESNFLFETSAVNGADKLIKFCFPYIPSQV